MPSISKGQDCQCGDVDGIGGIDSFEAIDQLNYLMDFLLGDSLLIDSTCADVDYREGITVGDFGMMLDVYFFNLYDWFECQPTSQYSYTTSEVDTIYVPKFLDIPEAIDSLKLPLFISYGELYPSTAHIPFLSNGSGANNIFDLTSITSPNTFYDNRINIKGDKSSIIHGVSRVRSKKLLVATLNYDRVQSGVGQVAPEILDDFLGRPMAIWKLLDLDLYEPVIKTYDVSPCCYGSSGNVDCDPENSVDISDLTFLIDHLFINFPELCCRSEANIDVDSEVSVDIADLTMLIDHLFINFKSLQSCQLPYLDN